jgi:hypothetical protein
MSLVHDEHVHENVDTPTLAGFRLDPPSKVMLFANLGTPLFPPLMIAVTSSYTNDIVVLDEELFPDAVYAVTVNS